MLTIQAMRAAVDTFGTRALDWTSRDILEALTMVRAFEDAGQPYDRRRASEYHDELAIVVQVRQETAGRTCCPCCGRAY